MASCEHCWWEAQARGLDYGQMIAIAEREGWDCTRDGLNGRRLRAGEYWDDATQTDRRMTAKSAVQTQPVTPTGEQQP